ncbi:DUF1062 domain-containing protein [Amycolatopsis sp. NPDC051371]|uniref:DUF1062 domain-containing protein n=1 Tax=Amycolatopsis sp. NPDC051371 TaxID=3155800 RepID=UPI00341CC315
MAPRAPHRCGDTVKLTVLERVDVRAVRPELLDRLHANDPDPGSGAAAPQPRRPRLGGCLAPRHRRVGLPRP